MREPTVSRLDRSVVVTYGSETGNAQDFAEELGRMVQRLHFHQRVVALDELKLVRSSLL